MFDLFTAAGRSRCSLLSSRSLLASVVTHGLLFSGAVYASTHLAHGEDPVEEVVTYMELSEQPVLPRLTQAEPAAVAARLRDASPREEPRAEPTPREETTPEHPARESFQDLLPPAETPPALPEVDPTVRAVRAVDFDGLGVAGGVALGLVDGEWRSVRSTLLAEGDGADGGAVAVERVDEKPRLANTGEIQRLLRRFYPPVLREEGISGQVLLRFVINTEGRVEPASVRLVGSTHDAFGKATTRVVDRLRFRPASIEGRRVRVLVSLPIVWTIQDV